MNSKITVVVLPATNVVAFQDSADDEAVVDACRTWTNESLPLKSQLVLNFVQFVKHYEAQ